MIARAVDLVREDCSVSLKEHLHGFESLRRCNIVVVGGTGFLGTWIAESLAWLNDVHNFGCHITLLARGTDLFKNEKPHLASRADLQLIKSDVRNTFEVPRETHFLIHAAANPDTRFHSTYAVETMTTIAQGTEAVLRAAERCSNLKLFLNVSSGLVYGTQPLDLKALDESFVGGPSLGSTASYAEAKRYGEVICQAFRAQFRLPVAQLRPFAFLGPYQNLNSAWAVSNFIQDALLGRPIRVLGDGTSVRSYMYGSDFAAWALVVLARAQSGDHYNVGSVEEVTLLDLATRVAQLQTPSLEIALSTGGRQAPSKSRFVPDLNLAKKTLGLKSVFDLNRSLARSFQWHRLQAGV
jgi:nucleoside-diphosphate-sugar epimerase